MTSSDHSLRVGFARRGLTTGPLVAGCEAETAVMTERAFTHLRGQKSRVTKGTMNHNGHEVYVFPLAPVIPDLRQQTDLQWTVDLPTGRRAMDCGLHQLSVPAKA